MHSPYISALKKKCKGQLSQADLRVLVMKAALGDIAARDRVVQNFYPIIIKSCASRFSAGNTKKSEDLDDMVGSVILRVSQAITNKIKLGEHEDPIYQTYTYILRVIKTATWLSNRPTFYDKEVDSVGLLFENDKTSNVGIADLNLLDITVDLTNGYAVDVVKRLLLQSKMKELTERERFVINGWFGQYKGLQEIADELGVCVATAYNIKRRAICRLQKLCLRRSRQIEKEKRFFLLD